MSTLAPRWPQPRLLHHTPNYPELCCLAAFTPKGSLLHLCCCCSQKALPPPVNIYRFLLFWGTVAGPSLTAPTPTHYRSSFMTPSALAGSAVWERNGAISFILGCPGLKLKPEHGLSPAAGAIPRRQEFWVVDTLSWHRSRGVQVEKSSRFWKAHTQLLHRRSSELMSVWRHLLENEVKKEK